MCALAQRCEIARLIFFYFVQKNSAVRTGIVLFYIFYITSRNTVVIICSKSLWMSMGARRHGKEGALAPPLPLWKWCKVFCALVVTAKCSLDELLMHYFHNLSSASGSFAPRPPPGSIPGPRWGTFVPRPLICPPLEKNSAGARVYVTPSSRWRCTVLCRQITS